MWNLVKIIAIGGLVNAGFAENSDFLIVISHSGRGIFNCSSGERTARDARNIWDVFDDKTGKVEGFDILENQNIQTHGLFGGDNLPKITVDNWKLENIANNILLSSANNESKIIVGNHDICELRTFGFSDNSKFLIIATSCDVTIYSKSND